MVTSGAALTSYRGEITEVRAGSLFVMEPGEVHGGEPLGVDGYGYVAFYPSVAEMQAAAGNAGGRPHFARLVYDDAELAEHIAALHRLVSANPDASHAVALSGVLGDLAGRHASAASAVTYAEHTRGRRIEAEVQPGRISAVDARRRPPRTPILPALPRRAHA